MEYSLVGVVLLGEMERKPLRVSFGKVGIGCYLKAERTRFAT